MEEIKFKPSLKIEKKFLVISLFYTVIIIILGLIVNKKILYALIISVILISITIINMILKKFTTYIITSENKIIINYHFISKSSKIYRFDQVKAFKLSRNLFEKWTNLGSISFGIFGQIDFGLSINETKYISTRFISIENYKEIFEKIFILLKLDPKSEIILNEKPFIKPSKFWIKIYISLILFHTIIIPMIILGLGIFFKSGITFKEIIFIEEIGLFISLFFSHYTLTFINEFYKFKSSNYIIKSDYLEKNYDYFFGSLRYIIPMNSITNILVNKNLINYKLFKVGSLKILTSTSLGPTFKNLLNFENFSNIILNIYKNSNYNKNYNIDNKNINELKNINNINSVSLNNKSFEKNNITSFQEKCEFKTKPLLSFILSNLIGISIFFLIFIILLLIFVKKSGYFILGLVFIYLIYILYIYFLYKNTTYEFYNDKIVSKSGVININSNIIYFENLKYILLSRNLIDRILGQGSLILFTSARSLSIISIKEYKEVYDELKELLK